MGGNSLLNQLKETGVVGVMRAESANNLLQAAQAIREGGVNFIEVAMTTPNALSVIQDVSEELDDVLIGAGTVLDSETARAAILAGAEYLVSPTVDVGMIEMAKRYGKIAAPGAFTPS
ncbi:2-dehydro-3-deoxyphosphogluconate aldolase, partial [archaeon SCG-AAA382B04]